MAATGGETSLTLDRGLTVLSLLARNADGLTAAELAERLSIARAAVYRLLRTLEAHSLVARIGTRYILGFGVAELAGQLKPRLQATVLPILRRLSEQTNSTALLSVADGDQALILLTAEPPNSTMHLAMREGARHALSLGADGIAILAGRPESDKDAADVHEARRRGHAVSVGAIQEGAIGIAAPIRVSDWSTASLGVVQLGLRLVDEQVPHLVTEAARTAATRLVGAAGPESARG